MREATEGYQPAYDDKAWDKMELLLDKHLPRERKRRRLILLLLPLLLVGTGIFLITQKQVKNNISETKNTGIHPESVKKLPESVTVSSEKASPEPPVISKPPGTVSPAVEQIIEKDRHVEIRPETQITRTDAVVSTRIKIKEVIGREQSLQHQPFPDEKKYNPPVNDQESDVSPQEESEQNTRVAVIDNNTMIARVSSDTAENFTQIAQAANEEKHPDTSKSKEAITGPNPQKQKLSSGSKLSVSISAGPDISSVGIDNPGKWRFQYGIGLSYALSKQWSIRTGFFAGRKQYSADSTQYYSSYYPPNLDKIDANCLVYEIPVNLIYHFPATKKHNWFIAGGLSSYLMKKETYDYYYKNAWGQQQFYSRTYKSENSHLFSVINISGGYQYHFTDRLSLMAEPYVRIPVTGVGSGKVKLNSGGVLFSLGFKPFLKRK